MRVRVSLDQNCSFIKTSAHTPFYRRPFKVFHVSASDAGSNNGP